MVYDEIAQYCDCPSRVDCGGRPICDQNDEHCGEVTTPGPTLTCDVIDCGQDGYVEEGPCEQCVCECAGGAGHEICCSAGMYWNPAMEYCDAPSNIPSC